MANESKKMNISNILRIGEYAIAPNGRQVIVEDISYILERYLFKDVQTGRFTECSFQNYIEFLFALSHKIKDKIRCE